MTPTEFKAAREEILAGFANKNNSRKIFGLLLGYDPKNAGRMIAAKERGDLGKPITRSDVRAIGYLLILRRNGLIMHALATVPELSEDAV